MFNFEKFYNGVPARYYAPTKAKKDKVTRIANNEEEKDQYLGTVKYDGEYSRIIILENEVIIQSRSLSKVTGEYGRHEDKFPYLMTALKRYPAGTVLLGELCYPSEPTKTSKDVGAVLRCKTDKALLRLKENPLELVVFDILAYAGVDLTSDAYENRMKFLEEIFIADNFIHKVATFSQSDAAEVLTEVLSTGGEGIMLVRKDSTYEFGTRTAWKTLKVKTAEEPKEYPIVGVVEPTKEYKGKEAATWKYKDEEGNLVNRFWALGWKTGVVILNGNTKISVASGLNDDDREFLATEEAQELIKDGKLFAEVGCMAIQESGSMRHPYLIRLRNDL